MGAQGTAEWLEIAETHLGDVSEALLFVHDTEASVNIPLLNGCVSDLDALIEANAKMTTALEEDEGAANDLQFAQDELHEALEAARAANGDDTSSGITALIDGITDLSTDIDGLQGAALELRGLHEQLTKVLNTAKAEVETLIRRAKQVQADAGPMAETANRLRSDAEEMAEKLRNAVA